MHPLTHSLITLWRRFRWEILGYLALVILSCISNSAESRWVNGVTSLRALGVCWLTFRILLSEAGFSTQGGWRARPLAANSVFMSQILLLLAVVFPGCLAKAVALHHLFHPTPQQWMILLKSSYSAVVLPWLFFILFLKGFEYLIQRQTQGRARRVLWAGMLALLVPAFILPASKARIRDVKQSDISGGYGSYLCPGIQRLLPQATDFIGNWYGHVTVPEVPQARILARFSFGEGRWDTSAGVRVVSLKSTHEGFRCNVTLDQIAIDPLNLSRLSHAFPVLAYADGSYGTAMSSQITSGDFGGIASGVPRCLYQIQFFSPLSLPENRGASPVRFAPTELLFFDEDPDLPPVAVPARFPGLGGNPPPVPPLVIPLPRAGPRFDLAVRQLIDSFNDRNQIPEVQSILLNGLPREAMPSVLAYHPWSGLAWEKIVRPFLEKYASDEDKSALLQRLASDSRLTRLFIENGWSEEAVPVLRQRASERLSLDAASLALLAEQNDPALGPDIFALAIRLDQGVEALSIKFRQSPAFVAAGWKSRKYENYGREGWLFACWSAELGDFSGFHRLAEEAASGKEWEAGQLPALVSGEHTDIIGYLRENIDRMKFDPATRRWGL